MGAQMLFHHPPIAIAMSGGAPVSAGRSSDVTNIAQEVQNVNDGNDHATTRKAPVSPGELIEPGYNTEASTRNIAQEAQNVNEENDHTTTKKTGLPPESFAETF